MADLRGSPKAPIDNPAVWVPQPVAAQEGWANVRPGWHPLGDRATLALRSRAVGDHTLELALLQRTDAPVPGYLVTASVNGHAVGMVRTVPGLEQGQVFLPPGLLKDLNHLELQFDPPVEAVAGDMQAQLSLVGIGVRGDDEAGPVRGMPEQALWQDGRLQIDRAGLLVVPWEVPANAQALTLEAEGIGTEVSNLDVFVLRETGEQLDLATIPLTGGTQITRSMRVSDLGGEEVTLGLEVEVAAPGGGVSLASLWVEVEAMTGPEHPAIMPPVGSTPRPDVILIILDAARGDRFPGWDYPRPVMPNLTELSRSSLTFRHAYSECPTTSCSIPALLTGLSFLPGGEVGKGKQLSDEVTTLAEHLEPLGYRSVGFSATPNNSASRNLDQGFDVFRELWGRGNPDHGPFSMARLASQVIRDQDPQEPLFLQLHFLPPHQPYAPGPDFDRFTDPGYAGSISPGMSLGPVNEGLVKLSAADLEHLVGLYDGNLLLADFVVEEVLDALRSVGRFENSLIVITSDHGEAFMEHGLLGHNTTLFDEMLHVPLMIRLPEGEVPRTFDGARLASTLDVVPTILGYLGKVPIESLSGLDLVRSAADPKRPRTLFLRTSHPKNGLVAARTLRWKQISWPRRQVQMLFDLDADPREQENLVAAHPTVYAGMGLRLRRHLIEAAKRRFTAAEIEMTPEAEEALRALGYLD